MIIPRRLLVLAGLLLPLAGVAQLPAGLAAWAATRACAGACLLAGAEGTLWAGAARLFATSTVPGETPPQGLADLRWRFAPGLPGWEVSLDGRGSASVRMTPGGLRLAAVEHALPASALEPWLNRRLPLRAASGRIALAVSRLDCAWHGGCTGAATLAWQDARLVQMDNAVLGSFRLAAAREALAAPWHYTLAATQGPLRADLAGSLAQHELSVEGRLRLEAGAPPSLAQLFAGLGRPGADGDWAVRWTLPLGKKVGAGGTGRSGA